MGVLIVQWLEHRAGDSVVASSSLGRHAAGMQVLSRSDLEQVICTYLPMQLTVAYENPGANHISGSGLHCNSHCDTQSWAWAAAPFLQCLGRLSLLPSVGW